LKWVVVKTSVDIVRFLGIPVLREGFYIFIPGGSLLVGNPCSGLRSLIIFMALGALSAHMLNISLKRKIFLFLSAIPIAILSNIFRVPILILISHFWGLQAAAPDSFWHTASGVLVFGIGLMLLYFIGRVFQWKNLSPDI
jgi:exosortase